VKQTTCCGSRIQAVYVLTHEQALPAAKRTSSITRATADIGNTTDQPHERHASGARGRRAIVSACAVDGENRSCRQSARVARKRRLPRALALRTSRTPSSIGPKWTFQRSSSTSSRPTGDTASIPAHQPHLSLDARAEEPATPAVLMAFDCIYMRRRELRDRPPS
jgi:hypothetical protein